MGLLYKLGFRGQKALTGTPAVLETLAARQLNPYPALGGTNINSKRASAAFVEVQNAAYGWIYLYNPPVRRVVEYIAGNVAQLGLKVYKRVSDEDREQLSDHPGAAAMREPNPLTHGKRFIADMTTDFLVWENAYALKFRRTDGGPLTLVRLYPGAVGIEGRSHFEVEAYRIWRIDGTYFDVSPQDVVHWRGSSVDDPRRGESRLETLRQDIATDTAARGAISDLMMRGLAMRAWLERPLEAPEISQEGLRRLKEQATNMASSSRREVPVWEEGMVMKQGGISPEDAELLAGRQDYRELVASIFGLKHVPPEGDEERMAFYRDVLTGIAEDLAGALTLQILRDEYLAPDTYFEFSLDEKLMGDDRIKALTSAAGAPIFTRNEARARANLPAVEGGDELITPLNVVVGDNPKPSVDVMGPQNPNGPPQDGSHRTEDMPMTASLNGNGHKKALLLPRHIAIARRRDEYAQDFQSAIESFVGHVERATESKGIKAVSKGSEEVLAAKLQKVAHRTVAREGGITAARLAHGDIDMRQVENYLKAFSAAKAKEIVTALRSNLDEGDAGDVFDAARNVDAPRAATGMATAIAAFAAQEAGRQEMAARGPLAPTRYKTWMVVSDNSEHPDLDGEQVPLGAEFSNGTDGPPADHPGCMCCLSID